MSYTLLHLGEPRLKGKPKGSPWTPPDSGGLLYYVDITNEGDFNTFAPGVSRGALGFEQFPTPLNAKDYEDEWGIYPELPAGFWWFRALWEGHDDWARLTTSPVDPVDGDAYWGVATVGDSITYGAMALFAFLDWDGFPGTWTPPSVIAPLIPNPWGPLNHGLGGSNDMRILAPTGPIEAGMTLRFKVSIRSGWGDVFVAWLDSDGDLISYDHTELFALPPETDSDGWQHWYMEGMDQPPVGDGLNSLGPGFVAPNGTLAFVLGVVPSGTMGPGAFYIDAMRLEVWA